MQQAEEVKKFLRDFCTTEQREVSIYKARVFHPISSSLKFAPFFVASGPYGLAYAMSLTRYDRIDDWEEQQVESFIQEGSYTPIGQKWYLAFATYFTYLEWQDKPEYNRYTMIVSIKKQAKQLWDTTFKRENTKVTPSTEVTPSTKVTSSTEVTVSTKS